MVKTWNPDLILLDIMMPRISGFEVCKRLRADPASADIVVLMITALDQPSDIDRAVEAGTDEFLSKPINKSELILRVRALRLRRDPLRHAESLRHLTDAARDKVNIMPHILNAVESDATVGEIADTLRSVFGEYRESVVV